MKIRLLILALVVIASLGCKLDWRKGRDLSFSEPPINTSSLTKNALPDGEWLVTAYDKTFDKTDSTHRLVTTQLSGGQVLILYRTLTPNYTPSYVSGLASISERDGVLLVFVHGIIDQQQDDTMKSFPFQMILRFSRIKGSDKLVVSSMSQDISEVRKLLEQSNIRFTETEETFEITDSPERTLNWLWANNTTLFAERSGHRLTMEPVANSE